MRTNCLLHVILSINSSDKFPNFICLQYMFAVKVHNSLQKVKG